MSERRYLTCGTHGQTPATFVCRHVTEGIACGFHASADDPDDLWPDAWCDLCEEAVQLAGGEWDDASEKLADIQLMCTGCYEAARSRNIQPPPHARGVRAHLTTSQAEALYHHATHAMQAAQEASQGRWGWHTMAHWDFDDEASTLTFRDPIKPTIVADVRLVGSYSIKSSTFQWAWATFDACAPEARDIARLRLFGEVRGLAKLTTANWACDECEGWDMTALAGHVLGAEAVYRAPFDHQRWFMLLANLRHVN